MSILIDEKTPIIVQGMTGDKGSFHTKEMVEYGTNVVGGVTPGKGGTKHQGLIGSYIHRVLSGLPLEVWGTGEVVRDFLHVDDVSDAFLAAVTYEGPHKILNVGSGVGSVT